MPDSASPWDVLYGYVLREWCDDYDTPAAEESTRQIMEALSAAGYEIVKRSLGPVGAA